MDGLLDSAGAGKAILAEGEKVFVILRRMFEGETRKHFAGTVEACVGDVMRLRGNQFLYDTVAGLFVRKPEQRTRLFRIDNGVKITILPKDCDLDALRYAHGETGTVLTDGGAFRMDVSEFTARS